MTNRVYLAVSGKALKGLRRLARGEVYVLPASNGYTVVTEGHGA